MNTTTERTDRDRRIWQIREILSRVGPEDMTDAELEAAIAGFRLAESRLPGGKPIACQADTSTEPDRRTPLR